MHTIATPYTTPCTARHTTKRKAGFLNKIKQLARLHSYSQCPCALYTLRTGNENDRSGSILEI